MSNEIITQLRRFIQENGRKSGKSAAGKDWTMVKLEFEAQPGDEYKTWKATTFANCNDLKAGCLYTVKSEQGEYNGKPTYQIKSLFIVSDDPTAQPVTPGTPPVISQQDANVAAQITGNTPIQQPVQTVVSVEDTKWAVINDKKRWDIDVNGCADKAWTYVITKYSGGDVKSMKDEWATLTIELLEKKQEIWARAQTLKESYEK